MIWSKSSMRKSCLWSSMDVKSFNWMNRCWWDIRNKRSLMESKMFKDVLKVCKISIFTIFLLKLKLKIFFCQISIFLIYREIEVEDFFGKSQFFWFFSWNWSWRFFGKSEFIDFSPEIEFYIFFLFLANFNFSIFVVKLNLRIFLANCNFSIFHWNRMFDEFLANLNFSNFSRETEL